MKQYFGVLLGVLIFTSFFSTQANAVPIPIVWGTNEKIVKIYDLPQTDMYEVRGKHMDLGYKYKAIEIFWVPLYTYEGTVVGYINSETYISLSNEQKDMLIKMNKIPDIDAISKVPFWDAWGGKLVVVLLIVFVVYMASRRKEEQPNQPEQADISTESGSDYPNKSN